jgi:hypothetical protein
MVLAGDLRMFVALKMREEIYSALVKGDTLKWLFKRDVVSLLYFVRQSVLYH